jgi:DNA-binding transcriptional MerR regulator
MAKKNKSDFSDVPYWDDNLAGDGEWEGLTKDQIKIIKHGNEDIKRSLASELGFEPRPNKSGLEAIGYSLRKIAELTNLTSREIRYLIQKDLLAGPNSRGRDAMYSTEFLVRAMRISNLKRKGLSIKEIKRSLSTSDEGLPILLEVIRDTIGQDWLPRGKCEIKYPEPSDAKIHITDNIYFGIRYEADFDKEDIESLEELAEYIRLALTEITRFGVQS